VVELLSKSSLNERTNERAGGRAATLSVRRRLIESACRDVPIYKFKKVFASAGG
jgi:hypothetical protein